MNWLTSVYGRDIASHIKTFLNDLDIVMLTAAVTGELENPTRMVLAYGSVRLYRLYIEFNINQILYYFQIASEYGNIELVNELISNNSYSYPYNAINDAAKNRHTGIIDIALTSCKAQSLLRDMILFELIQHKHIDLIRKYNHLFIDRITISHFNVAAKYSSVEIIEYLYNKIKDLHVVESFYKTIIYSVEGSNIDTLRWALKNNLYNIPSAVIALENTIITKNCEIMDN